MYKVFLGKLDYLVIHRIGNKRKGDGVKFSNILIDDFSHIVEKSFENIIEKNFNYNELFHFFFQPSIELNPIYTTVNSIFQDKESFIDQSKSIGRYLYDKSMHPNIKLGELFIFYMRDCSIDGKEADCIGIFKSESKDKILKIEEEEDGYRVVDMEGININKLDKGCLIFNTNKDNGYILSIVDNTSKGGEAQYWKNDFLSVQPIKTEYHQTNQFLGIAKQFVTQKLANEWDTIDKSEILGRSLDYFKNNEVFDKQKFEEEVFQNEAIIESFRDFDEIYRKQNELTELSNIFEISPQAVKKQARAFKSVLKLDKNFHIYIHGNRDLIEKGIDENGRKFYKIFYEEEL